RPATSVIRVFRRPPFKLADGAAERARALRSHSIGHSPADGQFRVCPQECQSISYTCWQWRLVDDTAHTFVVDSARAHRAGSVRRSTLPAAGTAVLGCRKPTGRSAKA